MLQATRLLPSFYLKPNSSNKNLVAQCVCVKGQGGGAGCGVDIRARGPRGVRTHAFGCILVVCGSIILVPPASGCWSEGPSEFLTSCLGIKCYKTNSCEINLCELGLQVH